MSVSMFFFVLACQVVSGCEIESTDKYYAYLQALGLAHGLLEHLDVRLLGSANSEVDPGSHLFHLNLRKVSAGLLCLDQVAAHANHWLDVLVLLLFHRKVHDVLQTFHVKLLNIRALEQVQEERFRKSVRVLGRALESATRERNERLETDARLLVLELRKCAHSLGLNHQLQHIQNLPVKHADDGQAMRALLAVAAEDHHGGIVLLAEKFQA